MNKLTISHYDTCLPDYFSGHHLPYIQIPAYKMTLETLKQDLKHEAGEFICNLGDDISEELYNAILSAIDDITLLDGVTTVFDNIDSDDDDQDEFDGGYYPTVFAYFLIQGID